MLIDLSNTDKKATIDDEDYPRVSKHRWYYKRVAPGRYYIATSINQDGKVKTVYLHRFIMQPGVGQDVHHKDKNPLDNCKSELEVKNAYLHRNEHLTKRRNSLK